MGRSKLKSSVLLAPKDMRGRPVEVAMAYNSRVSVATSGLQRSSGVCDDRRSRLIEGAGSEWVGATSSRRGGKSVEEACATLALRTASMRPAVSQVVIAIGCERKKRESW